MINRIDYIKTNTPAIETLFALKKQMPSIDPRLRGLIEVRISQINGCAHCVDVHSGEARKAGEVERRMDAIAVWEESPFFDAAEKAAFAWVEAVTRLPEQGAPAEIYNELRRHFSDEQVVDLTLIVGLMNFWNRLAVSFEHQPEPL